MKKAKKNRRFIEKEIHHSWHFEVFDSNENLPPKRSPMYNEKVDPAFAAEKAKEYGYDTFEIIHEMTIVRRYEVK